LTNGFRILVIRKLSPGSLLGGFGRPVEATVATGAALMTTSRLPPVACMAWTMSRVPRATIPCWWAVELRHEEADALFKMAFARRCSWNSRSSSAIRCRSSVAVPGLRPASTSAWLTEFRSLSGIDPELLTDPGQRARPLPGHLTHLEHHPHGPLTQLVGVPRC
jgi:hypothetical protein